MIDLDNQVDLRPIDNNCQHYKSFRVTDEKRFTDMPDRMEIPEGMLFEVKTEMVMCLDCSAILAAGWEYDII